jgi:acyl-CoA thioesterase-1
VIAGIKANPTLGKDYCSRFDAIYPDLAAKYDAPLYPFFLEGVAGEPGLKLADGMHPNAAGVEQMVKGILPTVETFLKPLRDKAVATP